MTNSNKKHRYYAHNQASSAWTTSDYFIRGLVSAGCLAVAGVSEESKSAPASAQRTFKKALQGGVAVAAGYYAAESWRNGQAGSVLVATAVGAIGVLAIEKALFTPNIASRAKSLAVDKSLAADTPLLELKDTNELIETPPQVAKKVGAKKVATKKSVSKRVAAKKIAAKRVQQAVENKSETAE